MTGNDDDGGLMIPSGVMTRKEVRERRRRVLVLSISDPEAMFTTHKSRSIVYQTNWPIRLAYLDFQ